MKPFRVGGCHDDFDFGGTQPGWVSATTGGPLDLSVEAASAAEAVTALHEKIANRLERGAILINHPVHPPRPPIPVLPLSENPLFDAWLAAVETYRAERETLESSNRCETE